MPRKPELDPTWRWDSRTVPYDHLKKVGVEVFIESLKREAEGLTDPKVSITGYGDPEYGTDWIGVSVEGTRPKTEQELERERDLLEWQKQQDEERKKTLRENERKEFLRLYKKFGKPKEK